jgi:CHAD domain-containing protein
MNAASIPRESAYVVPGELSTEAVTESLLTLLPTRRRSIATQRFTVLDTVDGRVRQAGACLTRAGVDSASTVKWQTLAGSDRFAIRTTRPVGFAWDLPEGRLREEVAPIVGPRRLLAQAEAEEQGALLEMLDDRGKAVARLRIASGQARLPTVPGDWRPWPAMLTLTGVRGHEDDYERLVSLIVSRPGIQRCFDGPVAAILRQVGASEPRDLSSPKLSLDPEVRADIGARQIHRALLEVLVANEPGVRGNVDSEFLHDFRVAIRRTRSLLGQVRHVFPADVVEHFAGEFSWIGRLTGSPRDTDVLVLALRQHQGEFDADDMSALIAFLGGTQQGEYERLVSALDSGRYQQLLADWKAFLDAPIPHTPQAEHAHDSLAAAVSKRAWRLSKRIAKSAKAVDRHTTAERMHEIRIDAKKLRYLVDAASDCYRHTDVKCILAALKKLQRALGDFNDAHVQENRLVDCGRAICAAGGPSGALLTLGRLAERCRQRRDDLREEVAGNLAQFRDKDVRKACKRAFDMPEPPIRMMSTAAI